MSSSNKPIKVTHFQKLANQSMLNGAFMIEIANNFLAKVRKTLVLS